MIPLRILITAIGSMSAACAIQQLKSQGYYVVGCDIYPGQWHYETTLCDEFVQAPYATKENEYINFLIDTCKQYDLHHIIPLTDLEIDVINRQRNKFDDATITLCMQQEDVLAIARDKYQLYKEFEKDVNVPSVKTCILSELTADFKFPCIAKPFNGRSSEGLLRNASRKQVMAIENKDIYIIQEQLEGSVFTVDYCRSAATETDCAVPRQELLRTANGAGLTIQTISDPNLIKLVSYIGNHLNINGCVNMEFILNDGKYYLIDINPRFSAGVAFSLVAGYDMVNNHILCFNRHEIAPQIPIKEQLIIKRYEEVTLS